MPTVCKKLRDRRRSREVDDEPRPSGAARPSRADRSMPRRPAPTPAPTLGDEPPAEQP